MTKVNTKYQGVIVGASVAISVFTAMKVADPPIGICLPEPLHEQREVPGFETTMLRERMIRVCESQETTFIVLRRFMDATERPSAGMIQAATDAAAAWDRERVTCDALRAIQH